MSHLEEAPQTQEPSSSNGQRAQETPRSPRSAESQQQLQQTPVSQLTSNEPLNYLSVASQGEVTGGMESPGVTGAQIQRAQRPRRGAEGKGVPASQWWGSISCLGAGKGEGSLGDKKEHGAEGGGAEGEGQLAQRGGGAKATAKRKANERSPEGQVLQGQTQKKRRDVGRILGVFWSVLEYSGSILAADHKFEY